MKQLIKNVKIITENKILEAYSLEIQDGIIRKIIEENKEDRKGATVIDGKGRYLSPGFIDIHNHGNSGFDAMDATGKALEAMSDFHLRRGVTGFLATTMTNSREDTDKAIKNAADCAEKKVYKGAGLFGLYLEGPYFCMEKRGAQPAKYIREPKPVELLEMLELSNGLVKIVALAPELEGACEAIRLLKSRGITVSVGHSNATFEEAMRGISSGATQATHLYNGMRSFNHRDPGIIGACLLDDRVFCEIICDGIHIHSSAIEIAVKMKGRDKIILISDAMRAAGLKDGKYDLGGQLVTVKGNDARLADGTLAGSTLTLDRAVNNMVKLAGVPLIDAVYMASLNPAKSIGVSDRKGSIEAGKDADLILFDENIDVSRVWISGEERFCKKDR